MVWYGTARVSQWSQHLYQMNCCVSHRLLTPGTVCVLKLSRDAGFE
jgi:hypothetical protein